MEKEMLVDYSQTFPPTHKLTTIAEDDDGMGYYKQVINNKIYYPKRIINIKGKNKGELSIWKVKNYWRERTITYSRKTV